MIFQIKASPEIGYGHLFRVLPLALEAQKRGEKTIFRLNSDAEAARLLAKYGFDYCLVSEEGEGQKAEAWGKPSCRSNCTAPTASSEVVVIDHYDITKEEFRRIRSSGFRVCLFDDMCQLDEFPVDWIVNAEIDISPSRYPQNAPRLLLGPEYLSLRRDFIAARKKGLNQTVSSALVIMGGSDPENQTSRCIDACLNNQLQVYASTSAGADVVSRYSGNSMVTFFTPNDSIAEIMNRVDLAISGAGMTAFELACVGVPAILLQLAENQKGNASAFSEREVALSLGSHRGVSNTDLIESVRFLRNSYAERELMMQNGQSLIDGKGAQRILEAISSPLH